MLQFLPFWYQNDCHFEIFFMVCLFCSELPEVRPTHDFNGKLAWNHMWNLNMKSRSLYIAQKKLHGPCYLPASTNWCVILLVMFYFIHTAGTMTMGSNGSKLESHDNKVKLKAWLICSLEKYSSCSASHIILWFIIWMLFLQWLFSQAFILCFMNNARDENCHEGNCYQQNQPSNNALTDTIWKYNQPISFSLI